MDIKANQLPQLDVHTKRFINEGGYLLFSIANHPSSKYLLIADSEMLLLSDDGLIQERHQKKIDTIKSLTIVEPVYFSDIELPPSTNSARAKIA